MDTRLADLLRLLTLEQIEDDVFRGDSRDIGSPQVYGGQVLGQALRAAYATVPQDRDAHSLHAYFLKRGDFNAPIVYFVDRARDGHSFSARRVTALQHGQQIFNLSASFQQAQPGVDHQMPMPAVPMPEQLVGTATLSDEMLASMPEKTRLLYERLRPFEFRQCDPVDLLHPAPLPPVQSMWFRSMDRLPDEVALHRCLLAYASDFSLLSTAMRPHAMSIVSGHAILASIDHVMWFHRPARVDEWLLYHVDSPSASGSRGFARGSIYTRDGTLVVSTAQEGLIRVIRP
jgi:acyl-CoA thioesterase-2